MNSAKQAAETLGYNVAWLRKQHGLTKKKMAQILGIGVKGLTALEDGSLPPRMSTAVLFNIHAHFHVSPDTLFRKKLDE